MIKTSLLTCLLLCAFFLVNTAHAQQTFKTTSGSVIGYLEYLPDGYHNSSKDYPVVIFLHGMGERGPNTTDRRRLQDASAAVAKNGPPKHAKNGTKFPFILISPQLKSNYGGWPTSYVMEVIDHVKKTLRIDESRIYLTGLSMGGFGTWTMAQAYPKMFAAVAPVCGGGSQAKAKGIADANLPVWAFHGDQDNVVHYTRSVSMVNEINRHNPNPKAKLSIYKGVRHSSWENAYQPNHSIHQPNVYEWLLSHRRGSSGSNTTTNKAPIAQAGNDKTIKLPTNHTSLTGTAKDEDGKIQSVKWTKISGRNASLSGANSATVRITSLQEGEYVFRFTAKDDKGKEASDDVKVFVRKADEGSAPVANAGKDITVRLPQNRATLQGRATVSNAKITSYKWDKKSGGSVSMSGASSQNLKLTNLKTGRYVFQLTVRDDKGRVAYDETVVTVNAAANNNNNKKSPVANAGPDITQWLPVSTITIRGSAKQGGAAIVSYKWTQNAGKKVRMSNTSGRDLKISGITSAGVRAFKLTVRDKNGRTDIDHVRVIIRKPTAKKKSNGDSTEVYADDQLVMEVISTSDETTPDFSLLPGTEHHLANYSVLVFSEDGERIFAGPWDEETYEKVFVRSGLYIYHVIDGTRRIHAGKIMVR